MGDVAARLGPPGLHPKLRGGVAAVVLSTILGSPPALRTDAVTGVLTTVNKTLVVIGMKIGHCEPAGEESGAGSVWICNTRTTSPMDRAHHPRPFGCGLRVTVKSGRTRTVVDPGRIFSFFVTVVATPTSDSERSEESRRMGFSGRDDPAKARSNLTKIQTICHVHG